MFGGYLRSIDCFVEEKTWGNIYTSINRSEFEEIFLKSLIEGHMIKFQSKTESLWRNSRGWGYFGRYKKLFSIISTTKNNVHFIKTPPTSILEQIPFDSVKITIVKTFVVGIIEPRKFVSFSRFVFKIKFWMKINGSIKRIVTTKNSKLTIKFAKTNKIPIEFLDEVTEDDCDFIIEMRFKKDENEETEHYKKKIILKL